MDLKVGFHKMKEKEPNEGKEPDDVPSMSPLKGDEKEVKGEAVIKILTPDKLLNRLPVLLAQIKAGNDSYKLKYEIRQKVYLFYQHNINI